MVCIHTSPYYFFEKVDDAVRRLHDAAPIGLPNQFPYKSQTLCLVLAIALVMRLPRQLRSYGTSSACESRPREPIEQCLEQAEEHKESPCDLQQHFAGCKHGDPANLLTPLWEGDRFRMLQSLDRTVHFNIGFEVQPMWRPVRPLGCGTFGDVYLFQKQGAVGPALSAVKRIKNVFNNQTHLRRAMRELVILSHLRGHSNIAALLTVDLVKDSQFPGMYLFMESMDMDLATALRNSSEVFHDWHVSHISYQLLSGVHYFHSAHVVHRDLKPSNILLTRNGTIKVCDFGLARVIPPSQSNTTNDADFTDYVTTRWYRAPEVLMKRNEQSFALDMWAVGCIMAELVLRRPLFRGSSAAEQMMRIIETLGVPPYSLDSISPETAEAVGNLPLHRADLGGLQQSQQQSHVSLASTMPSYTPPRQLRYIISSHFGKPFLDILEGVIRYNPSERLTAAEALASPFFDATRECLGDAGACAPPPASCDSRVIIPVDNLPGECLHLFVARLL